MDTLATIGRYRIEALLGQGGMGRVYRAWDEVLHRRVAIKVLFAASGEAGSRDDASVRRVLREARMVAALEHPNVIAIHDVGEHDGAPYIVMEHVAGASLRAFVGRADVPLTTRVAWLVEVARALSAAHRAGLVHRDVKPENVMIRDDGAVKVLDFGIARRATEAVSAPLAPRLEVASERGDTLEGAIVGTPAYMAPEQIQKAPVDARADQFAWGVLAYELLSGAVPWTTGTDVVALLKDVLFTEPAPLPPALGVPANVAAAVLRALAKAPEERFPSMDAVLAALDVGVQSLVAPPAPSESIPPNVRIGSTDSVRVNAATLRATPPTVAMTTARPERRRSRAARVLVPSAALLAALTALASFWASRRLRSEAPSAQERPDAAVTVPPSFAPRAVRRLTFQRGCAEYPSFTPDARQVVFDTSAGSDTHLAAVDLVSNARRTLTSEPGWQWAGAVSPDGKLIAYLRQMEGHAVAHLLPIDGVGAPRPIASGPLRPSWSPDGRRVWAGAREEAHAFDVDSLAIVRTLRPPEGFLMGAVLELADGRAVARFREAMQPINRGLGVYAAGASSDPLLLTRDELAEVLVVTPDARWALVVSLAGGGEVLTAYPLEGGAAVPLPFGDAAPTAGMVVSRAEDRVVWSTCASRGELALLAPRAGGVAAVEPIRIPTDWVDYDLAWIPGTHRVIVVSFRAGRDRLWVIDRDDREPARPIPTGYVNVQAPAVSPDGRWVAFEKVGDGIHVVPLEGGAPARRLTSGTYDTSPVFSRDGGTVYFDSRTSDGRRRVDSVPFAGGSTRVVREGARGSTTALRSDVLAYVQVEGQEDGTPMLLNLKTGTEKPLGPRSLRGNTVRLSPDARRAVVRVGTIGLFEIDVGKGTVVRRYEAGNEEISGLAFTDDEILATRRIWSGDLWLGETPFAR
jgi:serine/threonine protein kinase/Tol biopolymer transport system component